MNRREWSQKHTKCMVCGWEHYDRVMVNRLRGRADDAITEAEVDKYVD